MPVPSTVADLSSTASSNYPSGSESIGTSLDDYLRSHAAIIRQVSDAKADSAWTQSGTGAVSRTVSNKLKDVISIKDYGAVCDGVTDDTAAINAAIDAAESLNIKQIRVSGTPRVTSTIVIDVIGLSLIGDGAGGNSKSGGSAGVVPTGSNTSATNIVGDFNGGPVIRIQAQGCTVRDLSVSRSSTAYSAAHSATDCAILVSGANAAGYQTARMTTICDIRVFNQNGDGIILANDVVSSSLTRVEVNCVKGSAFVIAGGSYLSYTYRQRPGIITLTNCVAAWTGGHSIRIGGGTAEVDSTDIPYRVVNINFEGFYNCIVPAVCVSDPGATVNAFVSGENHTFLNCAVDGRTEYPAVVAHTSLAVRGNNIRFINQRLVQTLAPGAYVLNPPAGLGSYSRGIDFDNLYVVNSSGGAAYFNPVVNVAANVKGVSVTCNQPDTTSIAAITKLTTRRIATQWREEFNGVAISERPVQLASCGNNSGTANPDVFTLADDNAGYFEWDGVTKGVLVLSGNVSAAQSAIVSFRCGDGSAFVTSIAAGANVDVTTGALADAGGTDTKLTISADTATNRVYISNRLGAAYTYSAMFIASNTNNPGTGVVGAFTQV